MSPVNEKEIISNMNNKMRSYLKFLDETNWMYENKDGTLPYDN
jgi:hypothetical protein